MSQEVISTMTGIVDFDTLQSKGAPSKITFSHHMYVHVSCVIVMEISHHTYVHVSCVIVMEISHHTYVHVSCVMSSHSQSPMFFQKTNFFPLLVISSVFVYMSI